MSIDWKSRQNAVCPNVHNSNNKSISDAVKQTFGDKGFDVAFECVGVEATMTDAVENIEKGGTIVIVGVFAEKPRIDVGLVQDRELKLIGTLMYKYEDYIEAVKLIESGKVITEPLYSKHFPLRSYNEAYKFIEENAEKTMKVFIDI